MAVEATTLASAPLIYFNRNRLSIEATWKYLLLCSVGIALAMLGILFLAYAALLGGGIPVSLQFDDLLAGAATLSPPWLHAGFVFLLVGFGTKMGLAPLHTWKPDAYGEAPGMVGALLAGGLTSVAFLAILRGLQLMNAAGDGAMARQALLGMGLLSLLVAAVFMVRQPDIKRLLAYSSVEHMGILAIGVGIGGLATFGAMLHLVNNALTKGCAVPLRRQHPARLRQQDASPRSTARWPPCRSPAALPGRLPGHHRLAPLRSLHERVHHPARHLRQRPAVRSAWSCCCCWRWSSSAWGRRC